jgi:hypothetical protein
MYLVVNMWVQIMKVGGKCRADARQVPGRCPAEARQMPGRCPAGARQVCHALAGTKHYASVTRISTISN